MNKDKQIEEMVIALTESQHEFDKTWHKCLHNGGKLPERENVFYAKYLIENKGYRKAEDIAREMRDRLNKAFNSHSYNCRDCIKSKVDQIAKEMLEGKG